jgi:hypothetical protein
MDKNPFDRRSAWVDILISANHKEGKVLVDNKLVIVKRGQFLTSEVKISERWKWGRTAVRSFLQLLESDGMIHKLVQPNKFIIIEVLNYDKYQNQTTLETTESTENTGVNVSACTTEQTTAKQQTDNSQTSNEQLPNTNNNDNNDNNNNNENKKDIYTPSKQKGKKNVVPKAQYAEYVTMTESEHQKLVAQFGTTKVERMIEVLDNYKGSIGKIYKSDYKAILSWVVDKVNKEIVDRQAVKKNNPSQPDYEIKELEKQIRGLG